MKKYFYKILFTILVTTLITNNLKAQNDIPEVNLGIIEFCEKSMGKKIDRGECWDLAKFALDYAHAEWESPYDFGSVIIPNAENILPGDIIQFENVKLKDGTTYPHHTAIVYEILEPKKYLIVHQNFNNVKKVTTINLELNLLSKGTITFYRPR